MSESWIEIQWWRATYRHGDERKHSPWFGTREQAEEWVQESPSRITDAMRRTVRYEPTVVGAMTEDVAAASSPGRKPQHGRSCGFEPRERFAMTTMELGIEYRGEEWPHGLRCAECERLLQEGGRYSQKFEGLIEDTPVLLIVCVPCALASNTESQP